MNSGSLHWEWLCHGCGSRYNVEQPSHRCPDCGEPLSIEMISRAPAEVFSTRPQSLWHYADLLPLRDPRHIVSLGEGGTPLVNGPRMAERFGFSQLQFKNEAANPTGSFKDRQISVGISHAREIGADTVAVVSSGNVACAAGAYAAAAGMKAVLLMHGHAAGGKVIQASSYGACTVRVQTPSASAVFDLCRDACARWGWYHLSTAGMYEPFNVEGAKTIAYELYAQTGGDLPDWIVAPVGGGGLLGGIWRGFRDLQRLGLVERIPRLAGVQAAGCAPLAKAIGEGTRFLDTLKAPWPDPKTIAGGIADDILFDGHTVLPAIRTTNGAALAVTDDAILESELMLARDMGLLVEPTCAVVIAALGQLAGIASDERICCILTGSGIKDLDVIKGHLAPAAAIPADLAALAETVGERV